MRRVVTKGTHAKSRNSRAAAASHRSDVAAAVSAPSEAEQLVLNPISDISGTVDLPGSKSLSNRLLLLAALAEVRCDATVTLCVLYRAQGWENPFS